MTEVIKGIIREGKFTGCPEYAPYFWEQVKQGLHDDCQNNVYIFDITSKDEEKYPELTRYDIVKISSDRKGFIMCEPDFD